MEFVNRYRREVQAPLTTLYNPNSTMPKEITPPFQNTSETEMLDLLHSPVEPSNFTM